MIDTRFSICDSADHDVLYEGAIRNGRFGERSAEPPGLTAPADGHARLRRLESP